MWTKWLPWRFVLRAVAHAQGFSDPVAILVQLNRFSQPSEVLAPSELLRAGVLLHVRGLMNGQAIQHNLDWIWPYWVERQFDPTDPAFVPRAFNLTHINLTHRNWTALGVPDVPKFPLVDPRGLLMPHFDGWSLDAWIVTEKGAELIPCRLPLTEQRVDFEKGWAVETLARHHGLKLKTRAEVVVESGLLPVCRWQVEGFSDSIARLVLTLRPYNPEGISFVHSIEMLPGNTGWKVNGHQAVHFDAVPERNIFSYYRRGDVHRFLQDPQSSDSIDCRVGLATAAALFDLEPRKVRRVTIHIPFKEKSFTPVSWESSLQNHCQLRAGPESFQFLYDAAVRTLILHSPEDVYPGPYMYKRFWFRDAAFILHAMLCAGLPGRAERALDRFPSKQIANGYFLSQEGEWDSNGEALWIMRRYCEMTAQKAKSNWRSSVLRGGRWIVRKRLPDRLDQKHAGLLPAGFSAEHLGPNDFYYWDNFWGVAGLRAASYLAGSLGEDKAAADFRGQAEVFYHAVQRNLNAAMDRLGSQMIPASPYRRMDVGAIGSMVMSYPLRLCSPNHAPLILTAEFLMKTSFVNGGFFQEISHSGINPYLTLHVAQVLLRAGDERFFPIMRSVAQMASSTGQWPEAIHPKTGGGCMGDGQHVWASAEWVMMVRNCFVHEEDDPDRLILCQGLTPEWVTGNGEISFGFAPTSFGAISISVRRRESGITVSWEARWFDKEPPIEVRMPGFIPIAVGPGVSSADLVSEHRKGAVR